MFPAQCTSVLSSEFPILQVNAEALDIGEVGKQSIVRFLAFSVTLLLKLS